MTKRKIKVNDGNEHAAADAETLEQPEFEEDALKEEEVAAGAESVETAETGEADLAAEELERVKEEARESHDKMLRMAAELENFKKRMLREKETSLKYAEENILRELLPTVDNLERAIEQARNIDDVSALLEGVEMTHQGLLSTLERFGLTPIDGVGEPFDPNFHEALAMEASKEIPENSIMQEYQKGYLYKDRLLRAAKVVVSKGDV